jgi:hypothetical protein
VGRVRAGEKRWPANRPAPGEGPGDPRRQRRLVTAREVMRDLALVKRLEDRSIEKLVVTQRNQLRAVILSAERWLRSSRQTLRRATRDGDPRRTT